MLISLKRIRSRLKTKAVHYLRCGIKTATFIFWASIYMIVMKLTIFKSNVNNSTVKDYSMVPDNYTMWLLQGPVLGDDEPNTDMNKAEWLEPDNATIVDLEKRVQNLRNVCSLRAISAQSINSKEFFIDHAHNLVWCNIFKAASSSWLYKFNILGGYDKKFLARTRHSPLTLARKKFQRPSEEELRETVNTPGVVSLLVVREPFVRLLSAYRDKLENVTPLYYRKLAKEIVAQHRQKASEIFGPIKTFGPTFYEFVAYLIEKNKIKNQDVTFDEHWAPYHQFCSPCAVNFSVIAKVETLARDSAYVIQQLGLGQILGHVIRDRRTRLHTVMNKSRDGRNTAVLLKRYFSQLDEEMLNGLLRIYGLDFEMFGYDPQIYRRYIRK